MAAMASEAEGQVDRGMGGKMGRQGCAGGDPSMRTSSGASGTRLPGACGGRGGAGRQVVWAAVGWGGERGSERVPWTPLPTSEVSGKWAGASANCAAGCRTARPSAPPAPPAAEPQGGRSGQGTLAAEGAAGTAKEGAAKPSAGLLLSKESVKCPPPPGPPPQSSPLVSWAAAVKGPPRVGQCLLHARGGGTCPSRSLSPCPACSTAWVQTLVSARLLIGWWVPPSPPSSHDPAPCSCLSGSHLLAETTHLAAVL